MQVAIQDFKCNGSLCTNCNLLYSVKFAILSQVRSVSMNTNCNVPSSKQLRCANVLDLYRQPRTAFVYAILQVEVITSIRGDVRKDSEVSRCSVLPGEGWSCCRHGRAEVEGVVEHASWPILAKTIAAIIRAHRLIL